MNRLKVRLGVVFFIAVATLAFSATLITRSGLDTERHTRTLAAFDGLARSDTDLDRDVLEIVAGVLPNYDPLTQHIARLRTLLTGILDGAREPGALESAALWTSARDRLEAKIVAIDRIKGIAAFVANEGNYLPLAISEYSRTGPAQAVSILNQALILVLAANVPDDIDARLDARLAPLTGKAHPSGDKAGLIITHLQTFAEQRHRLRNAVDSYFSIPATADMVAARTAYLDAYAGRQAVVLWLIRGMLVLSAGLFATLGWLIFRLALADSHARHAYERMRKLNIAVEQSPMVILITDVQGVIEYANPRFTQLTGYRQDEAIGAKPSILRSGLTPQETYEELWKTISSGSTWQGELVNRKKNGELFTEQVVISPVFDQPGDITHYIAMKMDITRLRQNEEMLADASMDIERLLFAASHDLQEPVRTVTVFSQLLQRQLGESLPQDAMESLTTIMTATSQMRLLVLGLLRFARSGHTNNPFVPVPIQSLVNRVVEDLRPSLDGSVAITVAELPLVMGDASLLYVLIESLLSNALKFRRPGLACEIKITARPESHAWRIDIADNGIGMDPGDLSGVLRPFSRVHSRTDYPGAGMGLITALRIAKLHGGTLSLESALGQGTTVHLWLPKAGGEQDQGD